VGGNMRKNTFSKILVIGIIVLFFVVGFQPAFANDISIGKIEKHPRGDTFYRTFGGTLLDYGYFVQQTSDGGYILTGETSSYGAGRSDVWLIKTDSDGNKEWDKTFGGKSDDCGYCVRQTSDGGYIITGKTHSSGAGMGDVWLIKTDSVGNMLWNKTFGGSYNEEGKCIQLTSDGGYIIVGIGWLIKTDSDGNKIWDRDLGDGVCDSVQQTTDGGYIIAGKLWDVGGYVLLIKTDCDGFIVWNKTFGGLHNDKCHWVQETSDGGYILTGGTGKLGFSDVWLIKTDSNGNRTWDRKFLYGSCGFFVQQTSDDGFIITGENYGSFGGFLYVIKTDNRGKLEWENINASLKVARGFCVQETTDAGYIITGNNRENDVCLIKTDKDGNVKRKPVTGNMLLLRILERFPFLQKLLLFIN
jgi:hypothetical protein